MTSFKEIANAELTERDLPHFNNEWDQPLMRFAMSFNGYRFMTNMPSAENIPAKHGLGEFANLAMQTYEQKQSLPQSLSELRACLFFEGRRWHYLGSAIGAYEAFDKEGKATSYIHALLEAIARKIRDGERT